MQHIFDIRIRSSKSQMEVKENDLPITARGIF